MEEVRRRRAGSVCSLSRQFDTNLRMMQCQVKEDLSLKSLKKTPRQVLKPSDWEKRLARCKILLNKIKEKKGTVVSFSDETDLN